MSAVIPFFQPLSRLLSRLWKKANRVAAAESFETALDLDSIKAEALAAELPQATAAAASKPAATTAEEAPVVISFEAPNQRAARLQAQTKQLEDATIVTVTKAGPETKPKLSHQIEQALADYVLALKLNHCSPATIRNYKSDIKQFCDFGHEKELSKIFTKPKLLEFAQAETDRGLQSSTVKRKLVSIAQFAVWARKGKLITDQRLIESLDRAEAPDLIQFSTPAPAQTPETVSHPAAAAEHIAPASTSLTAEKPSLSGPSLSRTTVRFTLPALPEEIVTKWLPYFNLAVLTVFVIGLGLFTFRQFQNANPSLAYPTTLTRPNRMLSFQGRITNTADTPIVGATNMRFRLYDSLSGGTQLWDSNTCSIDPDQDGIFTTNLGAGAGAGADTENCGAEIASSVFSENPNVWLQVTIGAETLTPRQPIRTVAYALNAETLQGYPASASAVENTVLIMDNSGQVVLGNTNPTIKATGTSFTLEGNALTVRTTAGSATDLTLTGDKDVILNTAGTGVVIAQDYLAAPGATLSATYAGGQALTLRGGPSGTADILQWLNSSGTVLGKISSAGQIGIGNITPEQDLNVASNLQLGVTDGTRYIYFDNGTGTNAGIRYDSATDKMQFSNDGTTWSNMDSGVGAVTSVSNADGTLTITPTTGVVVASLNLTNANTWTGLQTFDNTNTDFAQYLRHAGDTDTFLNFTTDRLDASVGGKNVLRLDTNAVQDLIVVGDGTDIDTQILADSSATGLFVEGSTGRVGVGTNAPGAYQLDVAGSTNLSSGNAYYINGSSVLNATTLGTGVTGSSLTSVGALASGSIASGFGTIATGNTITGTTLNGTTGINTGASAGTQRIDSSGNLVNIGTTQLNTVTYTWPGADGTGGYILSTNGTGTLSWADPAVIVANSGFWGSALGTVYVKNNSQDLLVGGESTVSAKFAFMNVNAGTPTASVSAGTAGAAYLTATGNLATTAQQRLTLGGTTTGDIELLPKNGSGTVTATGAFVGSSTGNFGGALTVTTGGATITGNSTITGTLGSLTGLSSSGNIDLAALNAGGIVKAAATTGRLSIATGGTDYENPLTFGNGLTRSVNAVSLGGSLTGNTTIALGSSTFALSGNGSMIVGGTTADGKFQINGTADDEQLIVRANGTQTANLVEFQNSSGTALAYVSGTGVLNGADLATGGTTRVTSGGNLTNIGTTQFNTVTYTWPGADGSGSFILSTNGSGTLSWSDPSTLTAGSNYWMTGLGSVYLKNTTQDFLLGSQATSSAKFAVLNMNTGTPTASISGTTTNVATFLTGQGNLSTTNRATLTIGGTATGDIQLSPHGATGLYMDALGQVGIGDTTPAALFTVGSGDLFQVNSSGAIAAAAGITSSGSITFSGLAANRMVSTTTGGLLTTSITSANLASSITNETGSGVVVFGTSPTFTTNITSPMVTGGTAISSSLTLRSTSGAGTTDFIAFTVGNAGGTEAMRIINSGNIGIGSTNPGEKLEVAGTSDIVQFAVRANGTQTANLQEWQNSSGTALSSVSSAGVANFAGLQVNSAYTFPTTDSTTGYVLSTNGSGTVTWADPVTLTAASNYWGSALGAVYVKNNTQDLLVGGQASTSAKFAFINVNTGTPTASISGTTANVRTFLTGEGTLSTTNMATLTIGSATSGAIQLNPSGSTGLYINGAGSVGLNTTTPGEKLEVYNANSAINRGQLKFTQETAPGALTAADSGVAGNPNGTYTYRVTFVTANGETEGGTVSSGVTVASKQINLTSIPTGTSGVVTGRNIYRITNGGTSYRRLGTSPTIADNTTTTFTDNVADGSLNAATAPTSNTTAGGFFVGGSSQVNIDQLGRVGIGTTQPQSKLQVQDTSTPTIKIVGSNDSAVAGIDLYEDYTANPGIYGYNLSYSGSANRFDINAYNGSSTATQHLSILRASGFTGIGTNNPSLKLDVTGSSSSLTNLLALSNDSSTTNSGTGFVIRGKDSATNWTDFAGFSSIITDATDTSEDSRVTIKEMVAGTLTDVITLDSGNVGIGVTPGASNKLDVYNGGTQLFYVNTSKYAYAKRWYDIDNPTYYLESGSSATSLTIAGDISMATGKKITGSGLQFGDAGVTVIGGTSANTVGNLSINSGAGTLTADKITVNTIDPPYWINGNKYATFVPSIIGVKEEIAKTIRLGATTNPKLYQYVIDFDNLTEGSEMWLFSRVVDLDQNMENLTVLLSSDSDARVFYKKDLANRRLIFFGNAPAEVSFRLTAPRFDHALHPHIATDTDEHGLRPGNYVLGNTPSGALPVAEADLLAQLNAAEEFTLDDLGDIQIETTLNATPETSTVSLLDAQNQLIERFTAYTQAVIGKLRAGVIQTEHLSAESIAAPLATIDTLNTTNLSAQTATISGSTKLGALLANTATVSGSTTTDSLFAQTASVSSARMNYLEAKVAELDVARATSFTALTATISGTLYAENIADFDQKVANTFRQPSLLANLFGENTPVLPPPVAGTPASSAAALQKSLAELDLSENDIVINPAAVFIKNYFEVAGNSYFAGSVGIGSDLVIGDGLRLSHNELTYSPTNGDPTVFKIQPSGVGRLELMAGRLTVDEVGGVTITGDLRVAGAFTVEEDFVASGSALFNQGLLSKGNIEMLNAEGARVATLSANGAFSTTATVSAQTITATGVGSFGSLKLGSEVLTSTGSGTITTTQPTGKAKLSAGQTEITLKSELITPQTLIYVTPFGSTSNQVLFVKAQTAENLETSDKEGEFKVAVDQPLAQDVEFTWWIVN